MSEIIENFLRRWSTMEINEENSFLFEEHLMGVKAVANKEESKLLQGLSTNTPRSEFAKRFEELVKNK